MNLDDLGAMLDKEAAGLEQPDLQPALDRVRDLLTADIKGNFNGGHTPTGESWPPLKNPTHKPLVDTGALMASAAAAAGAATVRGNVITVDGSGLVPYAGFQNDGTRSIPAREFWGISDATLDKVAEVIADAVAKKLEG